MNGRFKWAERPFSIMANDGHTVSDLTIVSYTL